MLLNDAKHDFSQSQTFLASTALYGVAASSAGPVTTSFAQSVSLAEGSFTGAGSADVVVLNQATHSFTVLVGDGSGGFGAPQLALTTSTSDGFAVNERPTAIVAGNFTEGGSADLAVLMEDTGQIWIYSGNGYGTFRHTFTIPVGDLATGLTVVSAGNGLYDLLVGNGYGDVLILDGKGDGTFQIAGSRVSLSVVPNLLGPGQAGVLVGDQQNNRVTVQAPSAGGSQYTAVQTLGGSSSSSSTAQLAPGDVQWAFLDEGATLPDAIVVSTGSNSVEVYRTLAIDDGAPVFAPSPETFFVGTAPVSVTVADVASNGIPDLLVADQGSNDVTELFGSYNSAGDWVGIAGPRFKSDGDGPIAVAVQSLTSNGLPDLVVFNGGSGTVNVLPAVGNGFFDDQEPETLFNLGSALVQPPTFIGNTGVGYAVTAAGDLVRFSLSDPSAGANVVFSAEPVLAAQALSTGQVVAALANGNVSLLFPNGNVLLVESVLQAEAGLPTAPSAIDVVSNRAGQLNVLVSSAGSDTIFVFGQETESSLGGGSGVVTASAPPVVNSFQLPALNSSPTSVASVLTTSSIASSASATSASATASASTSSSSVSAASTTSVGLSLGTFSSLGNSSRGTDGAVLVAVEGNTYLSVPILDFGGETNVGQAGGEERMPWLSGRFNFGDTSALTRFVIGLDEALEHYDGSGDAARSKGLTPVHDPWSADLFQNHFPVPPAGRRSNDRSKAEVPALPLSPRAEIRVRFGDEASEKPPAASGDEISRIGAGFVCVLGLSHARRSLSPGRRPFSPESPSSGLRPSSPPRGEGERISNKRRLLPPRHWPGNGAHS